MTTVVILQYVTGFVKTEHYSAIQIFQYKVLKYIGQTIAYFEKVY